MLSTNVLLGAIAGITILFSELSTRRIRIVQSRQPKLKI